MLCGLLDERSSLEGDVEKKDEVECDELRFAMLSVYPLEPAIASSRTRMSPAFLNDGWLEMDGGLD